jgi:hypothetical protein
LQHTDACPAGFLQPRPAEIIAATSSTVRPMKSKVAMDEARHQNHHTPCHGVPGITRA